MRRHESTNAQKENREKEKKGEKQSTRDEIKWNWNVLYARIVDPHSDARSFLSFACLHDREGLKVVEISAMREINSLEKCLKCFDRWLIWGNRKIQSSYDEHR